MINDHILYVLLNQSHQLQNISSHYKQTRQKKNKDDEEDKSTCQLKLVTTYDIYDWEWTHALRIQLCFMGNHSCNN